MTIRDIQAHLERTLGTQLSHETISNITDAVAEEVKAWQSRPIYPGRTGYRSRAHAQIHRNRSAGKCGAPSAPRSPADNLPVLRRWVCCPTPQDLLGAT